MATQQPIAGNRNTQSHERKRAWMQGVISSFEAPLMKYATRMCSGDIERARDVVQDTFLKLWKADSERVQSHTAEWLYTVCRNRAIDIKRKEGRMTVMADPAPDSGASGASVATAATQDVVAEENRQRQSVAAAMGGLSDKQQEVIRLKFQGGLSYREISGVTGYSVTNVGYLLHTAIEKLRKTVAPRHAALMARGQAG